MKLTKTAEALKEYPLVIAKLGAGGDDFSFVPKELRPFTVLLCLDASQALLSAEASEFRKMVFIREVVAADTTPVTFIERAWWGCSSILPVNDVEIRRFGLAELVQEKARHQVIPTTLPRILSANNIDKLDFLITDLEGMDLAVIQSCEKYLKEIILIQCELRFAPHYIGEPHFHEAAKYLHEHQFQLLGLKPDFWRPVSSRMADYSDGCLVWGDCLFFRTGANASAQPDQIRVIKQVLLLALAQKPGYAAHLLEINRSVFDTSIYEELVSYVKPRPALARWVDFGAICARQAQLKISTALWYRILRARLKPSRTSLEFKHVASKIDNI